MHSVYTKMRRTGKKICKSNLENRLHLTRIPVNSLHSTIRCTLLCSRALGFLPLSGLTERTSKNLRFSLRTPYTVYYSITLFGQLLMFTLSFMWLVEKGYSFSNVKSLIFYSSSLVSSLILLNIGRFWPKLITNAEEIEARLPPFTRNVARWCNHTMVFILLAAVVDYLLSVYYGLSVAYLCDPDNLTETFFRYDMPWIFEYTAYSTWKGILSKMFNIQSTLIFSFNDMLLMVISIYLTEHFDVHIQLLKRAVSQDHYTCDELRTQYLKIVHLVHLINEKFSINILTSFGINVYWICTQLFYSLNKSHTGHFIACHTKNPKSYATPYEIEQTIYFTYSFSFLLLRTLLVLLLAARIHSASVGPLVVLYDVPSSKFTVEVERFIAQIHNIKVALSGLDFFFITRKMILTLLGTIATYELVLFQFNK